jgi:hypothetical protein
MYQSTILGTSVRPLAPPKAVPFQTRPVTSWKGRVRISWPAPATPMIGLLTRLFSRSEPVLSEATPRDAAAIAKLHAASFNRGWSEDEIDRLLIERNVLTHRAAVNGRLVGFITEEVAGATA